jgi:hypothetical protein
MTPTNDVATCGRTVEYAATFSPEPAIVGTVRQFVRASLARHAVSSYATELIVSELVANVVRHAGTDFMIAIRFGPTIHVSVLDGSPVIPAIVHGDGDNEGGRGLLIVDSLSSGWGVSRAGSGKSVWAEIDPAAVSAGA